jgi:dTDP-glucose pyrophosphorylase/CBS domain-containing protein
MLHGNLESVLIGPTASIRDAAACINASSAGIALVVDADRRLLGTLTDGDIRRAVLAGIDLALPVHSLLEACARPAPVTAPAGTRRAELLALMKERSVWQIPLVDPAGRVTDVAAMKDLVREGVVPLQAVIMAGGFGTRLMPLTTDVPKPMLHVGDKPILEHIVAQLQQSGIHKVKLTTHYKPEAIREHFGDGSGFGIDIDYVNEDEPLGTAGALGLVETSDDAPVLLMNGDILTRVDFQAMLAFHREHDAELTVGVRQYDVRVPYGVVQCEGETVLGIEEKPMLNFFVNAGIYLLEPSAQRLIPQGQRCDMTDLIETLTNQGRRVVAFPIVEYWLDVGRPEDYAQAQQDIQSWPQ